MMSVKKLVLVFSLTSNRFSLILKRQSHKMVKYTEAICLLTVSSANSSANSSTSCLNVYHHFVDLALKGLKAAIKALEHQ